MEDQFFVVLPSNSSMTIYPDNKISSFKVQLPKPLQLDINKWEVALSEIQYSHSWFNVRDGKNHIIKEIENPTKDEILAIDPYANPDNWIDPVGNPFRPRKSQKKPSIAQHIYVTPGHYSNINTLINQLNGMETLRPTVYKYDAISRRTTTQVAQDCSLILMGLDIQRCLGYRSAALLYGENTSKTFTDMKPYEVLYIYSDVAVNQSVGDVKAPLLRVVPIQSHYGEYASIHYDRPHFIPISRSTIDTIEMNIRDDTGDLISFESGRVIVTLVFRRKKALFYS